MQLPGRMQIARPKPRRCRNPVLLPYPPAYLVNPFPNRRRIRQISQNCQIIPVLGLRQQIVKRPGRILHRPDPLLQILRQHLVRHILGALHIRLVKGMQIQQPPGNGRSILPPVKLRPQIIAIRQLQPHYRMPRRRQRRRPPIQSGVILHRQPQIDKKPVAAIPLRRQLRLPGHRNNPRTLFAQTFRQQLLHPKTEPGYPRRRQQRQLVPPRFSQDTQNRPQPRPRIIRGAVNIAPFPHRRRPFQ